MMDVTILAKLVKEMQALEEHGGHDFVSLLAVDGCTMSATIQLKDVYKNHIETETRNYVWSDARTRWED